MAWNDISKIVERARTGDRTAYGELIVRFQGTVYAVALARLHNPTEAQELVQEVFIHSMTRLAQLRDPDCFPGWLRQITERMAINKINRRWRMSTAGSGLLESLTASSPTPLDDLLLNEKKNQLWQGLDRLKAIDRATLVAFYIQGRSLKQMSREFESPIGTIKRRLHVARSRLRRYLERREERATRVQTMANRPPIRPPAIYA